MFRHPKYYKELRDAGNELAKRNAVKEDLASSGSSPARNKSDQVISGANATAKVERASWSGPQASSVKPQAASFRTNLKLQAPSDKRPNQSNKRQASSHKQQAP